MIVLRDIIVVMEFVFNVWLLVEVAQEDLFINVRLVRKDISSIMVDVLKTVHKVITKTWQQVPADNAQHLA